MGRYTMKYLSEIYLTKSFITREEWQELINTISNYNKILRKWQIIIYFKNNDIRYYIKTNNRLPPSINGLKSFILKNINNYSYKNENSPFLPTPLILPLESNAIDIKNYIEFKRNEKIDLIKINFRKLYENNIKSKITIETIKNGIQKKRYSLLLKIPSIVLAINFESNCHLTYKNAPKYLDISKCLHLLKTNQTNSILSVDPFPYLPGQYYLDSKNINFAKHSIIFGSSGCGKSKLISLLVNTIHKNEELSKKYKVIIIDPHASLENDIGGLGKIIDFKYDYINLFSNKNEDTIISIELLLDIWKGLIPNNYNSKLERVLRHSLYLLLTAQSFNFQSLRKLLLELEYRNFLIKKYEETLPTSVIEFFLSEFNEIKTKSYMDSISPLIAFIDEIEMLPTFNENNSDYPNLEETITNNFLTILSLNRTRLGNNITKMISGLVMQQLFILIQNYTLKEHLIFIVDEVSVIENPILNKFLAEARKYNLSLILAGQYFSGISEKLQKAIFANVINYYIFRISKYDANILVDNLDMKIPLNDTKEQKIKIITKLQDRECIIRINENGYLLPTMKCKTLDFQSIPRKTKNDQNDHKKTNCPLNKNLSIFHINSSTHLKDILKSTSTSRKEINK